MSRAIGQTLQRVLVHDGAVLALPALLADARAVRTEAVTRAGRMRTIDWTLKCISD